MNLFSPAKRKLNSVTSIQHLPPWRHRPSVLDQTAAEPNQNNTLKYTAKSTHIQMLTSEISLTLLQAFHGVPEDWMWFSLSFFCFVLRVFATDVDYGCVWVCVCVWVSVWPRRMSKDNRRSCTLCIDLSSISSCVYCVEIYRCPVLTQSHIWFSKDCCLHSSELFCLSITTFLLFVLWEIT